MPNENEDWFSRLLSKAAADSAADEQLNAPLETLQDCYDMLDAGWPPPHEPPTFEIVQQEYRRHLWKYNPSRPGLPEKTVQYRTAMTAKMNEAYRRVCEILAKNPDEGLDETEESLIAERDRLLEGWKGWWCGTPSLYILEEYRERIEELKNKGGSKNES
ncbi:MAG: hypothetical protein K2X81_21180 [Candidatus Obscuribacterales bacterium]|nr:hypothetical protein [Candidatus Obscuribacterales bacterium]